MKLVSWLLLTILVLAESAIAIPAFPGAQGGGATSVGGRGGAVIEVVNLSNSGAGSLRMCVQASGPRTCVFRVGGTINLTTTLNVTNPFLTIAGQTAPGGGIQLSGKNLTGNLLEINTRNNVIVRYIRIRKGFNASCPDECGTNVRAPNSNDVILDHVTAQWNQDEGVDFSNSKNMTLQYSIVAEPVGSNAEPHATGIGFLSGSASKAVLSTNLDIHHSLVMSTTHRNPLMRNKSARLVNNLWYNIKTYGSRGSGGVSVDVIGNKYKAGPVAPAGPRDKVISGLAAYAPAQAAGSPSFYVLGNIGIGQSTPPADPFSLTCQVDGNNGGENAQCSVTPMPTSIRRATPLPALANPITAEPAINVEASILPTVGASRRLDCNGNWVSIRDSQDLKLINQYQTGTGPSVLVNGPETGYGGGGYPTLAAGTPCADTDHDGMPNAWETARGLNPNNAADRNGVHPTGFTNLEIYLGGTDVTEPVPQSPSVGITAPPNGATVIGSTVTVSADATDDAAVLGVQFKLDGANLGTEDTTSPYSVVWNTTAASEGAHTLTAVARDAVPNSTTSSPVTVTVDNIAFVAKFDIGDRVAVNNAAITVRTTPTEGGSPGTSLGNQSVGVLGTVLAGPITASNAGTYWQINYDTGVDGWSAEQFLDEVGVAVNTPPTVSLMAPANGATVSGPVTVTADAADPGGAVLGVQFKLDGVDLGGEDTTASYSVVWNSNLATAGSHQLGAVARDSGGLTTNAAARTVTVNNIDVCP